MLAPEQLLTTIPSWELGQGWGRRRLDRVEQPQTQWARCRSRPRLRHGKFRSRRPPHRPSINLRTCTTFEAAGEPKTVGKWVRARDGSVVQVGDQSHRLLLYCLVASSGATHSHQATLLA